MVLLECRQGGHCNGCNVVSSAVADLNVVRVGIGDSEAIPERHAK